MHKWRLLNTIMMLISTTRATTPPWQLSTTVLYSTRTSSRHLSRMAIRRGQWWGTQLHMCVGYGVRYTQWSVLYRKVDLFSKQITTRTTCAASADASCWCTNNMPLRVSAGSPSSAPHAQPGPQARAHLPTAFLHCKAT